MASSSRLETSNIGSVTTASIRNGSAFTFGEADGARQYGASRLQTPVPEPVNFIQHLAIQVHLKSNMTALDCRRSYHLYRTKSSHA